MTLNTWSFSKKKNSTATPTGSGRSYTVYMKENTSIENPVFILGTGIDVGISYCQAFGNYYFVDDIVLLTKDQVELHCSIDVLATHKTAIGSYTGFVERSASAHNAYIYDSALSATQNVIASAIATDALWTIDQDGCFIVRTVGDGGGATGISSWILSASELGTILNYLFNENNPDYSDIMTDSIVKTFFNPFQYIVSVMWFPFSKSDISGSSEIMQLGFWSPGTFKKMSGNGYYLSSIDITKPTNYYSNDFRAYHPNFTTFNMFLPGIGVINLDPIVLSHEKLHAYGTIDFVTGNINIKLQYRDGSNNVKGDIGSYSGQVGVPIPVAQINNISEGITSGDMLESVVGGALSAAENMLTGGVSGILNTIKPTSSIIGNAGNRGQMTANPRLISSIINYGCGEFPNTVYGRPLCAVRQVSTLSGYIKMQAASIALDAPDTETALVNNYLNSGFYYE